MAGSNPNSRCPMPMPIYTAPTQAKPATASFVSNEDDTLRRVIRKKTKLKKSLDAAFNHSWRSLPESAHTYILKTFTDTLQAINLKRLSSGKKRGGKAAKAKADGATGDSSEPSQADAENVQNWHNLKIGVNEVTRHAERGELSLLLVDGHAKPATLTAHLSELSSHNGIPAASVNGLAEAASCTGLQSLSCIGFKPLGEITNPEITKMVMTIHARLRNLQLYPSTSLQPRADLSAMEIPLTSDADDVVDDDAQPAPKMYKLPPEDVTFSSLYVFKSGKRSEVDDENFIKLPSANKNMIPYTGGGPVKRYMYTMAKLGQVKNNPNRVHHSNPNSKRKAKK